MNHTGAGIAAGSALHIMWEEMRRTALSCEFYLSVLLMILIGYYRVLAFPAFDSASGYYGYMIDPDGCILLCFAGSLCVVVGYCDDLENHYVRSQIIRQNAGTYLLSKITANFIMTYLSVFCSSLLFVASMMIKLPWIIVMEGNSLFENGLFYSIAGTHMLPVVALSSLSIAMLLHIVTMPAFAAVTLRTNRMLALVIPSCVLLLWNGTGALHMNPYLFYPAVSTGTALLQFAGQVLLTVLVSAASFLLLRVLIRRKL